MVDLKKPTDGLCCYAYNLNAIQTQPKRNSNANPTDCRADMPVTQTTTLTMTI